METRLTFCGPAIIFSFFWSSGRPTAKLWNPVYTHLGIRGQGLFQKWKPTTKVWPPPSYLFSCLRATFKAALFFSFLLLLVFHFPPPFYGRVTKHSGKEKECRVETPNRKKKRIKRLFWKSNDTLLLLPLTVAFAKAKKKPEKKNRRTKKTSVSFLISFPASGK